MKEGKELENEERTFFFLACHFSKRRKFILGQPKWKSSTGKKHFTPGNRPGKMTLPPQKNFPVTPLFLGEVPWNPFPLGNVLEYAPNSANRVLKMHFLASVGHTPPDTPLSLQWLKIYNSSGKGIKTGKVVGIDMKIDNILLEMNNGFSVKCWQRYAPNSENWVWKLQFFQLLQTPHCFSLHWPKIYNSSGKGIKTGKAGGIDVI